MKHLAYPLLLLCFTLSAQGQEPKSKKADPPTPDIISWDVTPCFAADYPSGVRVACTEIGHERLNCVTSVKATAHFNDVGRFEHLGFAFSPGRPFGLCVPAASLATGGTPLGIPVGVVICGSSKEQVSGIDAERNVATMADEKTFWNWPGEQLVSESMRRQGRLAIAVAEATVSVRPRATAPKDAAGFCRVPNAIEEPVFNWSAQGFVLTLFRAIFAPTLFDLGGPSPERLVASLTRLRNVTWHAGPPL
jgi:hypothetical protein